MHQYLKAIGFGNFSTTKELKKILGQVEKKFTHQTIISYNQSADFCEFRKDFGQGIGIALYGEMDILMLTIILPIFKAAGLPHTLR